MGNDEIAWGGRRGEEDPNPEGSGFGLTYPNARDAKGDLVTIRAAVANPMDGGVRREFFGLCCESPMIAHPGHAGQAPHFKHRDRNLCPNIAGNNYEARMGLYVHEAVCKLVFGLLQISPEFRKRVLFAIPLIEQPTGRVEKEALVGIPPNAYKPDITIHPAGLPERLVGLEVVYSHMPDPERIAKANHHNHLTLRLNAGKTAELAHIADLDKEDGHDHHLLAWLMQADWTVESGIGRDVPEGMERWLGKTRAELMAMTEPDYVRVLEEWEAAVRQRDMLIEIAQERLGRTRARLAREQAQRDAQIASTFAVNERAKAIASRWQNQPDPDAYEAFCHQCERCKHLNPCSHAMNTTLACTGGFTFEQA